MKIRDVILTGVLLILLGVMIGMIITISRYNQDESDLAEVNVVELTRNAQPLLLPDEWKELDPRFTFQDIASTVTPAVVFIQTTIPVQRRARTDEEGESDEGLFNRYWPGRNFQAVGSGVIISDQGYILTNNHVVENAIEDGIAVSLADKRVYAGRIVGTDPSSDLAVIKIDSENLPSVILGNSDNLRVGEWVLAIGNPFSLQSTVTAGIVSAVGRGNLSVIDRNIPTAIESFIQTDAAINRGNSGGALINTAGELVGINTAIATQNGDYQGYGFAVPSNLALKVAEDIIEFGEVRRGFLGVLIREVTVDDASEAGLDRIAGVFIREAEEGLAASNADVRAGDIVLEVEGGPVNESNELQVRIAMYRPGDVVNLRIWREGEIISRQVVLGGPMEIASGLEEERNSFFDMFNDYFGNFNDDNSDGNEDGIEEDDDDGNGNNGGNSDNE